MKTFIVIGVLCAIAYVQVLAEEQNATVQERANDCQDDSRAERRIATKKLKIKNMIISLLKPLIYGLTSTYDLTNDAGEVLPGKIEQQTGQEIAEDIIQQIAKNCNINADNKSDRGLCAVTNIIQQLLS